MRKTHYILYRRQYGDFDIAHDIPFAASSTKEHLKIECAHRNSILTEQEQKDEVSFWVSNKPELAIV